MSKSRLIVPLLLLALIFTSHAAPAAQVTSQLSSLRQSTEGSVGGDIVSELSRQLEPAKREEISNALHVISTSPSARLMMGLVKGGSDLTSDVIGFLPRVMAQSPETAQMLVQSKAAVTAASVVSGIDDVMRKFAPASAESYPFMTNNETSQAFTQLQQDMEAKQAEWNKVRESVGVSEEEFSIFLETASQTQGDSVVMTKTFIDQIFGVGMDMHNFGQIFSRMNVVLMVLAGFTLLVLFLVLARQLYLTLKGKKGAGVFGFCMWFVWFSISLFVALFAGEFFVVNMLFVELNKQFWGAGFLPVESAAIQAAVSVGALTSSQAKLMLGSHRKAVGNLHRKEPVFCMTLFKEGDLAYNSYPNGSKVHEYNLRRIADAETDDSVDLDYVRALINQNPYPPAGGGVTSEQAQLFKAISNECEDFNGDIDKCCDWGFSGTNALKQKRCPGRSIQEESGDNHCRCIEVMSKMNFVVEDSQLALCTTYVRDEAEKFVDNNLGVSIRYSAGSEKTTQVFGCTGNLKPTDANLEGGVKIEANVLKPIPTATADELAAGLASWEMVGCMGTVHTIHVELANVGSEKSVTAMWDGSSVGTKTAAVGSSLEDWQALTFQATATGDHTLALKGSANGIPNIKRVIVCTDGSLESGCPVVD